jgi:hypothetical protein
MQEVRRIKGQHLNDRNAIVNGRVKGKINVTRAFGVGYLKQVTSVLLRSQRACPTPSTFSVVGQSPAVGGNSSAQRLRCAVLLNMLSASFYHCPGLELRVTNHVGVPE